MNNIFIKKFVFVLVALGVMGKILGMNSGSYPTKNRSQSSAYFDKSVSDKDVLLRGVNKIKNSIETFHLFSHGQEGKLLINGEWLNDQQIAVWFKQNQYLTHKKHLNIYGCNFAQGVAGAEAVAYLEKELGVSVAASNNITGKDGDWTLEVGQAVATVDVPNYKGNLQTCTLPTGSGIGQVQPHLNWDRNAGQAVGSLEQNNLSATVNTASSTVTMGSGLYYLAIGRSWQFRNLTATTVANAVAANQYMTVTIPTVAGSAPYTLTHWVTYNSYIPQTPNIAILISQDPAFSTYTTLYNSVNPKANTSTNAFVSTPLTTPFVLRGGSTYYVRVIMLGSGSTFYMDAFGFNAACGAICSTSTPAPTLSATTKTNVCPSTTVNLNSLVTSATPTGTTLVWFTNNTASGTPFANPIGAPAGTYYAYYFNALTGCYSPASTAVTTTLTFPCPCANGSTTLSQYASSSSGGYSSGTSGANAPDGTGISVYTTGTTYQGIFTYANTFTAGSLLGIRAKYNDSRVDGIFLAFSTDGVTWTANSPLINGFSASYTNVNYMVPSTMTGSYKYIRVQGNTANTYLNIDAIQETKTVCTIFNVGTYYDGGVGGGTKGNCTKDGTESAIGLPSNLYINFVRNGVLVKSFPVTGGTTAINSLVDGTYTMVIAQSATATTATTGDYSSLNGTQTVIISGGVITSPTTAFSFCIQALDSDSDGVPNGTDLDDDNDGILDTAESNLEITCDNSCSWFPTNRVRDNLIAYTMNDVTSEATKYTPIISTGSNIIDATSVKSVLGSGLSHQGGTSAITAVTVNNAHLTPFASNHYINTTFTTKAFTGTYALQEIITASENSNISIFISTDGFKSFKTLACNLSGFGNINKLFNVSAVVLQPSTTYDLRIYFHSQNLSSATTLGDDFYISGQANYTSTSAYSCTPYVLGEKDTDGDGILNRLDLDSDGDGCSDALEGGAWLSKPNLVNSTMAGGTSNVTQNLGNTVGNTATTLGVPTIAKEGQTVGSSTVKTVQDLACNCVSYIKVNTQAAIICSGGYSAASAGANPADGAGMSVYDAGTTYQGIFTYANTFTAGSSLAIRAKYNDSRVDGILLAFSADGTTWTTNSPLINGFSSDYTTVNYVVPATMTGAYKYIRVQGKTANSYLNIDAIQENTAICTLFNVSMYLDNGAGSGIKGNSSQEGGESETGLPSNLYINFVQNGTVVKSFPAKGATIPIIYLNTGNYTMVLANSATKTTAITGDYSCLNGTQTVTISAGGVVTGLTLPFSYGVQAVDSDKDGIADGADLDDDNDGILDINEQTKCQYTGNDISSFTFSGTSLVSKTATTITNANTSVWSSSYSSQTLTLPIHLEYKISSQTTHSMIGLLPSAGTQTSSNWNDGAYKFYNSAGTVYGYFPSAWTFNQVQVANELYEIDIDATGLVTAKIGGVVKVQFQGTNSTYRLAVSSYTGQIMTNIKLSDASSLSTCTELDTDGDGIPNRLDLDSDGDGCSDALEAEASLSYKDLVNSTMQGGSTSMTLNLGNRIGHSSSSLGVPVIVGKGQAIGSSADANINTCPCLYGENNTALYPTSATGNGSASWGDNAGVKGAPNVTSTATDVIANRWSVYNTTPGTVNFDNPIYSGDSIIMYVAHWAGYAGGFDVSLSGTSGTTAKIASITSAQLTATTYPYNEIKFVVPFSVNGSYNSIKIMPNNVGGTSLLLFDAIKVVKTSCNSCPSGPDAPKLSTTVLSYNSACSQLTEFNLSTITASNQPSGSDLTWHTDTPATSDNLVASLTSAPMGTYYASFYNVNMDCYSGFNGDGTATTKVIVSPDSDADGVLDLYDLDDDNDGILDINEHANCGYIGKDLSTLTFNGYAIASKTANTITNANTGAWASSYSNETFTLPIHLEYKISSQSVYSMIGLLPTSGAQTSANWNDGAYKFYNAPGTVYGYFPSAWTFSQAQVANELYEIDINTSGYVTVKISGVVKAQFQGTNSTYKLAVTSHSSQVMTNIKLADANSGSNKCTELDTDGDGIPNQLDLDSDGDGCPDALEGGGGFNSSNVYPSSLNGGSSNVTSNLCPTSTCIDSSGVPVAAGSAGQTVGSSQNKAVKSANCPN